MSIPVSFVATAALHRRWGSRSLSGLGAAVVLALLGPPPVGAAQVRVPAWSEFTRCRPAAAGAGTEEANRLRRLATCALPTDREQGFGTVLEPGRLNYGFVLVKYAGRTSDGTQLVVLRRQQLAYECSSGKLITRTVGSRLLDGSGAVVKESSSLTLWRVQGAFAPDRKSVENQFRALCPAGAKPAAKPAPKPNT